jgi:hypothetical protein
VRAAGVNPLVHYLKYGWAEGRSPYGAAREAELKADMRAIQQHYIRMFKQPVDFREPTNFMEKLQVYKLVFRNPIMHVFADKASAKKLVGGIIGGEYIVPLIGVYDCFADIPREKLPQQFVIKANHASGFTIFCGIKAVLTGKRPPKKQKDGLVTISTRAIGSGATKGLSPDSSWRSCWLTKTATSRRTVRYTSLTGRCVKSSISLTGLEDGTPPST